MSGTAEKTDPALWDTIKSEVTEADKGGKPGQWSARKAQLATAEYKKAGGGYTGRKSEDNHLRQWTKEEWGTKSGRKSGASGERYLPKAAREHLTADEYRRTTAKKRRDTKKGAQFSAQPADVAAKTGRYRWNGQTDRTQSRAELYAEARKRNVPGRSKMDRAALAKALQAT